MRRDAFSGGRLSFVGHAFVPAFALVRRSFGWLHCEFSRTLGRLTVASAACHADARSDAKRSEAMTSVITLVAPLCAPQSWESRRSPALWAPTDRFELPLFVHPLMRLYALRIAVWIYAVHPVVCATRHGRRPLLHDDLAHSLRAALRSLSAGNASLAHHLFLSGGQRIFRRRCATNTGWPARSNDGGLACSMRT